MDDFASTTNKVAVTYLAFKWYRDYLYSSSPDEIRTQNPYHSTGFLQPLFLPDSSCVGISCFLPRQYLSRLPVYSCRSVGLLSSGSFSASLLAYKLHLNSTTVCFVYKRSMHWCGQVSTTAADRSVSLWLAPPSQPALFVGNRDDRLMATSAFRNLARPTAKDLFCPSLRTLLNTERET